MRQRTGPHCARRNAAARLGDARSHQYPGADGHAVPTDSYPGSYPAPDGHYDPGAYPAPDADAHSAADAHPPPDAYPYPGPHAGAYRRSRRGGGGELGWRQ